MLSTELRIQSRNAESTLHRAIHQPQKEEIENDLQTELHKGRHSQIQHHNKRKRPVTPIHSYWRRMLSACHRRERDLASGEEDEQDFAGQSDCQGYFGSIGLHRPRRDRRPLFPSSAARGLDQRDARLLDDSERPEW